MKKIFVFLKKSWAIRSLVALLFFVTFMKLIDRRNFLDRLETRKSTSIISNKSACELPWWDGAMENCSAVTQTYIDQNNTTRSYCGKRADVVGKGQKVISYCLYGDFNLYGSGLPQILQTIRKLYPGWVVRIYTQPQNYTKELVPLLRQYTNLYICDVANLPGDISDWREGNPMLWRIAVLGDELVDVFLSRDIDAVILEREVAAVKEFMESGKSFHTMVDHHAQRSLIMGGMFGVRQTPGNLEQLNSIRRQFYDARTENNTDQHLMATFFYPTLEDDRITHASYFCTSRENSRPFPTRRENRTFVGNRRYRDRLGRDSVTKPCPFKCRPASHPDWEYC